MIIPGYDIIEKLGEGGTASVWKARQLSLNRLVAIKLLTEKKLADPEMMARFRLEAESTASLNHPGIIQIYDMGDHDQFAFLVMEFVDGEPLDSLLAREKRISPDQALDIAAQIAEAMHYAWDASRLVHCDIKPGNILVNENGKVKISDLGVSRLLGRASETFDQDMITGTPYYSSPEQVAATPLDARSDIYSLGATLYHAVTGQMPFADSDATTALRRVGKDQIPDPVDIDRSIPSNFVWLLEKMMMCERVNRPADWADLVKDIALVRRGLPPAGVEVLTGLSTIARSASRSGASKPELKIKKVVGAPVRVAPMAGSRPPLSPKKSKSKGRFLRPAIQQVLVLTILTACAYGIVVYLWKQPKPEPGAVSTELPENGIRRATEQEAARVTGALAEPTSGERAQAKASGRPASSWGDQAAFDQAVESIKASREEYKRFSEDQNQSRLDDVETLAREGLDVLERLQKTAPASVNISEQIRKGYESIFNARQSRKLDLSDASSSRPATTPPRRVTEPRAAPPNAGREIEELFSTATPIEAKVPVMTPAPVPLEPAPDFDAQPLGLAEDWNPDQDHSLPEVEDLISVLQAYGTPREVVDAASDMTFPGDIPYRMPIQLAGERLGLPVAGREALQNPALPQRSLLGYRFEGNFGDGMDICLLITDRKGQVVAAQCIRSNPALVPSLPRSLYSDRWSVANLLTGDGPTQDAWKVVHRVRRQNGGVVVDSEAVTPQRFEPRFTSRLYLPSPIVDLLLLRNMPPEEDFEE